MVFGACAQASPTVVVGLPSDEIGENTSEMRLTLLQGSRRVLYWTLLCFWETFVLLLVPDALEQM